MSLFLLKKNPREKELFGFVFMLPESKTIYKKDILYKHNYHIIHMKLRPMTVQKIKELYAKGERDFSNIDCREATFDNLKLECCNFSFSNLSFSSFNGCDLRKCNFTKSNVEWSGFRHANLEGANFTKANGSYCSYNDANMKDVIATDADMSWSFFFNVVKNLKDIKGTSFHMSAWHESEVRKEAVQQAQIHMMGLRGTIDQETFDRLGFIIHGTVEMAQKVDVHDEAKNPYKVGFGAGSNAYKIAEGSPAYGAGGSAYKTDLSYLGKKSIYKK